MIRNGIHITAWGTVISAFALAVTTFPEIAKSAENQQVEAQSTAEFEGFEINGFSVFFTDQRDDRARKADFGSRNALYG